MSNDLDFIGDIIKNKIQKEYKPSEKASIRFKKRLNGFNFMRIGLYHFNIAYLILFCSVFLGTATFLSYKYQWFERKSTLPLKENSKKIHTTILPDSSSKIKSTDTIIYGKKQAVYLKNVKQKSTNCSEKNIIDTIKITVKDTVVKKVRVTVVDTSHIVR